MSECNLSDKAFYQMRTLIYDKFGIVLGEKKRSLIVARLQKVLRKHQLNSFEAYYRFLVNSNDNRDMIELINHISTNHTFFYREPEHFNYLQETMLPFWEQHLQKKSRPDLRIWSAGCSSGEEPYTIMMSLMEYFKERYSQWDAGVLATDISERVLKQAIEATYSGDRISLLPAIWKTNYLKKMAPQHYTIAANIRREVTFRKYNLMNPTFHFKSPFHIIFCRNVMIYFDQKTRNELAHKFYNALAPGGFFLIGHSETLGRDSPFHFVKPSVYQKPFK